MLTKTTKPRQEEVSPLCSSWNVRQYEQIQHGQKRRRPLATLITELRQAVITEASRLRTIFHGQTAASASCRKRPATLVRASSSVESSASSADQPAAFAGAVGSTQQPDVIGCTGKRLVDSVSCAQPVRECKLPRGGARSECFRMHPSQRYTCNTSYPCTLCNSAGAAYPRCCIARGVSLGGLSSHTTYGTACTIVIL